MSDILTYKDAEQFLLGLVNYEQLPPPMAADAEGWHLREFASFLSDLGDPQKELKIIHVAGTKGKGSTTRMVSSLLTSLGWRRVGSFISPHIEHFRERICIDNEPISEGDFVRALNAVRAAHPVRAAEGFRTTFEVLTAMALWHFREVQCEAVVLETGLGGRLDSTNVAVARVALITAIGFEHQRVLGTTIRAIASEKAGIIKAGTGHAIVAPQTPSRRSTVVSVARERARLAGVPFAAFESPQDSICAATPAPWGFELTLRVSDGETVAARLHALGRHQLNNLRGALMAVEAFALQEGRPLIANAVRDGIESFRSSGRLEVVRELPLVLVDSAHCPLSAKAVSAACGEHFPGRPVILVLGLMRDKKPRPILRSFKESGVVSHVFTHTPPSVRARTGEDLAAIANGFFARVESCASLEEALVRAREVQRSTPGSVILVTGTTYSIAEARLWAVQNL